ncbi:MAG: hypothetical protein J6J05_07605 [Peptococcaceae bacterium]|nr:hypothetical protein [Peptococcaceae bacterium]
MTAEMKAALLFTAFVIGLSLTVFRSTWQPIFCAIGDGVIDIVRTLRSIDREWMQQKLEERRQRKIERGPLTLANMKERCAMPALFVAMIPVYLLLMRVVNIRETGNTDMGIMTIGIGVIGGLAIIVVWALGQSEKNLRRKFWMELVVALFIELMLVFQMYLYIDGYYRGIVRDTRRMLTAVMFAPFWALYLEKTNQNYQALQDIKRKQTTNETETEN